MSKPEFTPGPWAVNPICNGDYLDLVSERGEGTECVLFSIDADRPNAAANAALVAAAPDLYAALQIFLEARDTRSFNHMKHAEKAARAALAKVTG